MNKEALRKLAEKNDQPLANVLIVAWIIQHIGEFKRVLHILMGMVALTPVIALFGVIGGVIHPVTALIVFLLALPLGGVLFVEYLYSSKGVSFGALASSLERALCPEKNMLHRMEELEKTMNEVKDVNKGDKS